MGDLGLWVDILDWMINNNLKFNMTAMLLFRFKK